MNSEAEYEMQAKLRELEIMAHMAELPMELVISLLRRQFVVAALARCGNNRSHAAKALGKHRNTLHRELKDMRLNPPRISGRRTRKDHERTEKMFALLKRMSTGASRAGR